MKKIFLILAFSLAGLAGAQAANHVVVMKSLSYDPKKLQVKVGDTVEWTNKSFTEHSATSTDEPLGFETGLVQPKKDSKKISFVKAGEHNYHCSVHGKTMSGQIVVVP